jgi:uncharacterized protein YkwD
MLFAAAFFVFAAAPSALASPARTGAAGSYLQAVNATRTAHGLRPLRLDLRLQRAARSWSGSMLHGNYFAHGNFPARMAAFHIVGFAGENLAWGGGSYGTPQGVVAMWLASPEHRANLLRPSFRRIGIGLARGTFQGENGAVVVTADFGA